MTGFWKWAADALKYVFDKDGLRGIALVALLLFGVAGVFIALVTLTPLGDWFARWLGV